MKFELDENYENDPEFKRLMSEANWSKESYGGLWKGIIYALCVAQGIILYGATNENIVFSVLPALCMGGLFYVITMYDTVLVSLWNKEQRNKVMDQYVMQKAYQFIETMEVTDFTMDLDGTNEDE